MTVKSCARILAQTEGQKKIISVLAPPETGLAEGVQAQRREFPPIGKEKMIYRVADPRRTVQIRSLRGSAVYVVGHTWMAKSLANGKLQPKPEPMVVGQGLESIQLGLDTLRKGVSAAKIVVRL